MLDEKYIKILEIIQKNPKVSHADIAKKLGISSSSAHERIRKLEKKGVITAYSTTIDLNKVGIGVTAFVRLEINSSNWSSELNKELLKIDWIQEIHEIIGEDSYLLKVIAKDNQHLSDLLKYKIGKIPYVKSTETTLSLKTIKSTTVAPLNDLNQEEEK